MSMRIAKKLHTERNHVLGPHGHIERLWNYEVQDAFLVDASHLSTYCMDNPQFWGNYVRWLPLKLPRGTHFWIEYDVTEEMRDQLEQYQETETLAYHVALPKNEENTILIHLFHDIPGKRGIEYHRQATAIQLILDEDGKVEKVEYLPEEPDDQTKYLLGIELFLVAMTLTVISNPERNDVIASKKTVRGQVKNLNSRNAKKRKKANESAKIQYWLLEVADSTQQGGTMDSIEAEQRKDSN